MSRMRCGGTAKTDAPKLDPRADYQNAIDEYQACVNSNLKNVEACEDKREGWTRASGLTEAGNAKRSAQRRTCTPSQLMFLVYCLRYPRHDLFNSGGRIIPR
jgi:hypothetical protein